MSNRFVIFCFPRTGSYLLTDILNKQEGVTCHEEIFKKNRVELDEQYREKMGLSRDDMEKRDADPFSYLEAVYDMSPGPVTGFKIFPAHNREILLKLMNDTGIKKVFLARNPVQSYISTLVARETGAWTKTHHDKPDSVVQVKFPVNGFIRRIHEQRKFFERIITAIKLTPGNPVHIIDYSELKDPARMHLLAEYLGIESWDDDVIPKYKKQIVKPYPEIVADWDGVRENLKQLGVDETCTFFDFMTAYNRVIYSDSILPK